MLEEDMPAWRRRTALLDNFSNPYWQPMVAAARQCHHSPPMFQLSQLRCFVAVGTEMSFRRAAERLNMTQPPLTRKIQLLEHTLGVQLFERSGRNVQFTAAGERFYLEAQDLLRRAETAALSAKLVEKGESGSVAIGCFAFATVTHMPAIIERLNSEQPGISIALREMTTTDQIEALSSRILDLGVLRYPQNARTLRLEKIYSESFSLVMHRNHRLANRRQVTLDDIKGERFVMYSPTAGWYSHGVLNGVFIARNLRPHVVQYLDSTQSVLAMVNAGIGIALAPRSGRVMHFDNVVWREVDMPDHAQLDTYLAWPDGALSNPAVRIAHEAIRTAGRNSSQASGPYAVAQEPDCAD